MMILLLLLKALYKDNIGYIISLMGTNVKHIFPGKQKGCLKCTQALEAARGIYRFGRTTRA
jgi:hypothetical protein